MSERDFEINGRKFKLNKIDAFRQFHIVRRLAPIMSDLLPVAAQFSKMNERQLAEDQTKAIAPILNGLAKLSDEDSNRILLGLLSSVETQQQTGNWARVSTDQALMINDLELPILMQVAGKAFMYNMSGFFAVLPQVSPGGV